MNFQRARARAKKAAEKGLEAGRVTASKTKQAANKASEKTDGAQKAGVAGAVAGGGWALSITSLGGFGVVAGGTGIGVAGLTGAAVATGGVALAGFGGAYLVYKAGEWIVESRSKDDGSASGNEPDDPSGKPFGDGPSGNGPTGAVIGALPRGPLGGLLAFAEARRHVREAILTRR